MKIEMEPVEQDGQLFVDIFINGKYHGRYKKYVVDFAGRND